MEAVICAIIAAAGTVMVAVVEGRAAKDRRRDREDREAAARAAKEERERVERRAAVREQESRLSMEMQAATCALALVTAKKAFAMHTNGDVEEAMEKAKAAQEEYADFVRDVAAHQVVKA